MIGAGDAYRGRVYCAAARLPYPSLMGRPDPTHISTWVSVVRGAGDGLRIINLNMHQRYANPGADFIKAHGHVLVYSRQSEVISAGILLFSRRGDFLAHHLNAAGVAKSHCAVPRAPSSGNIRRDFRFVHRPLRSRYDKNHR